MTPNKDISEAIQKRLFELGYTWGDRSTKKKSYQYTDKVLLGFNTEYDEILFGNNIDNVPPKYKKITFADLYTKRIINL